MLDTLHEITTPELIEIQLRPAGLLPRSLAWLADFGIRMAFFSSVGQFLSALGDFGTGFLLLSYFAVEWFYPVLFEVFMKGATPGKRLMGLRVVQDTGEPLGIGTAFLRWVGYIVSTLPMLMGFLWAGADRRKQAWHDKIAGSVVIDLYQVVEVEIPPKNALTNQGNLFT